MRPLLLRALSLFAGLAVVLLLAEGVLRLFRLAPTASVATVSEKDFQSISGIFAPNQRLVDSRLPELSHQVTIDSLGYRGAHFPRRKEPGEIRVLMSGDSFTYGDGVHDWETIPVYLEKALRTRCPRARVINAGLPGAAILDELEMIRRATPLEPDLVILVFTENDESQMAEGSYWESLAANRRAKSRFPLSVLYPVMKHTALWNLALEARARVRQRLGGAGAPGPVATAAAAEPSGASPNESPGVSSERAALRRKYVGALRRVRDTVAAREVPLVFVSIPMHKTIADPRRRDDAGWAVREATAMGITSVDIASPFFDTQLPADSLYLLPHDGHTSARGNSIAASHLAALLPQHLSTLQNCASTPSPPFSPNP